MRLSLNLLLLFTVSAELQNNQPNTSSRTIKIYAGDGTSRYLVDHLIKGTRRLLSSSYTIETVLANDLKNPKWINSTDLVIIPGGRDLPYLRDLAGQANDNIKSFLQNGGGFLGFCAGAYYSSDRIEFEKGTKIEVLGDRPLKFYPGMKKGTTFPGFDYRSDAGALAVNVTFTFPNSSHTINPKVYYNGGGSFMEPELYYPNVQVIGTYNEVDDPTMKTAAVLCKVGAGRAILTGTHPEYMPDSHDEKFYSELSPYRSQTESLFRHWFEILHLKLAEDTTHLNYPTQCVTPRPPTVINQITV